MIDRKAEGPMNKLIKINRIKENGTVLSYS